MNNKIIVGIAALVAIAIVAYFFLPSFITGSVMQPADNSAAAVVSQNDEAQAPLAQEVVLPSGVVYRDEVVGSGAEAQSGSEVVVNYIGALTTGQIFDASSAHGAPFTFTIGAGQVIKGWDEGVAGMKVGGKRLMQIPANMAYGEKVIQGKDQDGKTVDVIPANSTLIFEVELLSVK